MTAAEAAVAQGDFERIRVPGAVRRAAGRCAAALLFLLLLPVLLVAMAAIKTTSPGPILHRQRRLGLLRRDFVMLKFRTMYVENDDSSHRTYVTGLLTGDSRHGGEEGVYKLAGDHRITPVGRFLRRTSIDELPQLINVLLGHMALVGPRPVLQWEAELFPAWADKRFRVRPGMTGLWQVSGRSSVSYLSALRFDVDYVNRRSVWLDLTILARTVGVLLGRSVAR